MERQKDSGRTQTAITPENEEAVEEMICSREDHPRIHVPQHILPRSKRSDNLMCGQLSKEKEKNNSKHLKTQKMSESTLYE